MGDDRKSESISSLFREQFYGPPRSTSQPPPTTMSTAALAISHSPTTTSSCFFSDHSGSPPALNANTLALLDAFLSDKADQEQRFNELAAEQAAARIAGLALDNEYCHDEEHEEPTKPSPISVAEFRLAFGEDWQLSQFW